jgi:Flp pilus assembly protein TadG
MICALRRFLRSSDATAAVEAAIFAPIFVVFTLGITDLGVGTFVGMQVNAGAQAGAAYAVINSGSSGTCASLTATCISDIQTAMDNATGNSSFCTASAQNPTPCPISFTSCSDPNGGICFTVTANYPYSPILPGLYSWAQSQTYSSTATVRIQ